MSSKSETTLRPKLIRVVDMDTYMTKDMVSEGEDFAAGGSLKSGFANLDCITNLDPGLYVLGAISSLGKTTFTHQMMDQIAGMGTPTLFFSMEQSALELASKSLSRTMAQTDPAHAMTALQIRKHMKDRRVTAAIEQYRSNIAKDVHIVECTTSVTMDSIENVVEDFIAANGRKPVVVVDYLQMIQPPAKSRLTDKQIVDMHVHRLKTLQSRHKLVMIVISSLNRQNYLSQVDFESFKESGGIEYTADVIWGLQLTAIHDEIFNSPSQTNRKREMIRAAKAANPRQVELLCVKNRLGISAYSLQFEYYPQWDYFKPVMADIDAGAVKDADPDGFSEIPEGLETLIP